MQLRHKLVQDHIPMRSIYVGSALSGLRGLSRLGQTSPNPYPNGVSVAGTGPNGSATVWKTGYLASLGVWVANTGFGIAPIYTDDQMPSIVGMNQANGIFLKGYPSHQFATFTDNDISNGIDLSSVGLDTSGPGPVVGPVMYTIQGPSTTYTNPGALLQIKTSSGGTQTVWYTRGAGGYWIPSHAQGNAKPSVPLFAQLIEAGAIIGAAIATVGATGILGPTTAGPGAEAIGGSAAADVGATGVSVAAPVASVAPVAQTTAPEISSFVPPDIAAPPVVDVSSSVPIDVQSVSNAAAAAAGNPLTGAFDVAKYINTLAGTYKTITSVTGGAQSHPQAGTRTVLPDGSTVVINVDGSSTIRQPNGTVTTVGEGGTVTPGYGPTSATGSGLITLAVLGLAYWLSPV
jgi:hypothetical protein